jgi:EAL domain-containing protein (putative c-di-GMP-specific phosphodiesterase class I)
VLLDGSDLAGANELGRRLLAVFAAPFDIDGRSISVTASVGLATVETPEETWNTAQQHADIALYEAKRTGKAALHVYEVGMRSTVLDRLELTSDLQQAIARHEFVLHYQPIVSTLHPGAPVDHVEALVRWMHPVRGLVPPGDFIPLAEQSGLIVPLGAWVLRTACAQARAWEQRGRCISVSVNVSGRQLLEPDFGASVVEVLSGTGLAATRLTLEITETALLQDLHEATRVLQALRDLGVRVSLDDFGAGYSSLTYLDQLPVDVVKIDRAFVATLEDTGKRATMVTITRLLDTMNVTTVAEGVETIGQLAYCRSLGVDAVQGYLFSRPVPAAEVLEAVRFEDPGELSVFAAAGGSTR